MFCARCGAIINDGVKFCTSCGHPADNAGAVAGTPDNEINNYTEQPASMEVQPAYEQPASVEIQPVYEQPANAGYQLDYNQPVDMGAQQGVQQEYTQQAPMQRQVTKYVSESMINSAPVSEQDAPVDAPKKKSVNKGILIAAIVFGAIVILVGGAIAAINLSPDVERAYHKMLAKVTGEEIEGSEEEISETEEMEEPEDQVNDEQEMEEPVSDETDSEEYEEPAAPEEPETAEEDDLEAAAAEEEYEEEPAMEEPAVTSRPLLLAGKSDEIELKNITPNTTEYKVEKNLANVINAGEFSYYGEDFLSRLEKDQFLVADDGFNEFFEVYESNAYSQTPNFVTVDAMMHTYHLYFQYLLQNVEKKYLYDELLSLSKSMLKEVTAQYKELKGTEWEDAAKRNVAYFALGTCLLDPTTEFHGAVNDVVNEEYSLIYDAEGVAISPIMGMEEDYSQYKPRGYYDGDEQLSKYFRAMMWYGRIQFKQEQVDTDRSALLMTNALNEVGLDKWEAIYSVTSFFAGASDDLTYYEYMPAIEEVYGEFADLEDITSDSAKWDEFHSLTAQMRAPRINSIPIKEGEDNTILGYRFMGQRFSVDATIMQNLIYSRVSDDDDKRLLPDVLDIPAALGSEAAYEILDEAGVTSYKNYTDNLDELKNEFDNNDGTIWRASLYAGWLNTLRPVLEKKGDGYPTFMQSDKWAKKDLETFAGSYTELKHDTVLYSKQVIAEMGGGDEEDVDDRGYVQPEPLVYHRFAELSKQTADGLKKYGYLSSADEENLSKLSELATKLREISIKELNEELPTDEEFQLIRDFGGEIEHFWYDAISGMNNVDNFFANDYPAALVTDIATDPNGTVLEIATGNPSEIYVIAPVEGKLRICRGSAFSFYEFEQPINDRLTDKQWWKMLGIPSEDYQDPGKNKKNIEHPEWVNSYRYVRKSE